MTYDCPMCGRRFEWDDDFGGRGDVICPGCGTAVAVLPGGPRAYDPEYAARRCRPPAVAVMIVGGLVILGGAGGSAMLGLIVVVDGMDGPADRGAMIGVAAAAAVSGLLAFGLGGLMLFGGWRMSQVRSWGLSLAASLAATVSCLGCCLFGVLGVVGLVGVPIGIWALVTLSDPQVKAAFD